MSSGSVALHVSCGEVTAGDPGGWGPSQYVRAQPLWAFLLTLTPGILLPTTHRVQRRDAGHGDPWDTTLFPTALLRGLVFP